MSEVIKVDWNEWTLDCHPGLDGVTKLKFASSAIIFDVILNKIFRPDGYRITFTVIPESNALTGRSGYYLKYKIKHDSFSVIDTLNEAEPTTRILFIGGLESLWDISLTLTFNHVVASLSDHPENALVKSYIERGPTITLIGRGGSVTIPRRLIQIWSSELEAILKQDSKEGKTGQILFKDFDVRTLTAFTGFLMDPPKYDGELEDGKQTALGLALLGDKYNIQPMKDAAVNFVKENINDFNKNDVLDIFYKISRQSLIDAMQFWSK